MDQLIEGRDTIRATIQHAIISHEHERLHVKKRAHVIEKLTVCTFWCVWHMLKPADVALVRIVGAALREDHQMPTRKQWSRLERLASHAHRA